MFNIPTSVDGDNVEYAEDTALVVPENRAVNTLLLIYYVADNNLESDGMEVLNSAERAADNEHAVIRMMLDGPGQDDAFIYQLDHDTTGPACPGYANPTCDGRYTLNQNMWKWMDDSADPSTVAQFVAASLQAYPNAEQVILTFIGHGSGISAGGLTGQPSGSSRRHDPMAGLLQDDNPQGASLSTHELHQALSEGLTAAMDSGVSRSKLDGIYLDACLMGMYEVAYEVRANASYLLVSPNVKWAISDYETHVNAIDGNRNVRQVFETWMQSEAEELRGYGGHPFVYTLLDLSHMDTLHGTLDTLALELMTAMPGSKTQIQQAVEAAVLFDSNGDSALDPGADAYVDIASFVQALPGATTSNTRSDVRTTAISDVAQSVQNALDSVIVAQEHESGTPWDAVDSVWNWGDNIGGLSIYLPLEDQWQRGYYGERHFQAAADGQWDELVWSYWDNADPPAPPSTAGEPMSLAPTNPDSGDGISSDVYLPLLLR